MFRCLDTMNILFISTQPDALVWPEQPRTMSSGGHCSRRLKIDRTRPDVKLFPAFTDLDLSLQLTNGIIRDNMPDDLPVGKNLQQRRELCKTH
jgi:hypothetical protein